MSLISSGFTAQLLASILYLSLCLSCQRPPPTKTTEFTGNAMTIDYRIVIGSPLSSKEKHTIQTIIHTTFSEVNSIYNKWNPHSELSQLNHLPANTPMEISPQLSHILELTDQVVLLSRGRFDPTIEPLQALWKKSLQNGTTPSEQEITEVIPCIGWKNIRIEKGVFTKKCSETMLDLGGIAKGYAVDLLAAKIEENGFSNFYVEWGGEIKTHGTHPDQRPWRVFISNFEDPNPESALAFVELKDEALATSGDYLQNWKVGDRLYFHVLDPFTYHPLLVTPTSLGSVSIACDSCAVADGLATAAITFSSRDEAFEWINTLYAEIPELRFWLHSRSDVSDR